MAVWPLKGAELFSVHFFWCVACPEPGLKGFSPGWVIMSAPLRVQNGARRSAICLSELVLQVLALETIVRTRRCNLGGAAGTRARRQGRSVCKTVGGRSSKTSHRACRVQRPSRIMRASGSFPCMPCVIQGLMSHVVIGLVRHREQCSSQEMIRTFLGGVCGPLHERLDDVIFLFPSFFLPSSSQLLSWLLGRHGPAERELWSLASHSRARVCIE